MGEDGRNLLEKELQSHIRTSLANRLADPTITDPAANLLKERVAAGQVVGWLGDPREGVITLPPKLPQPIKGPLNAQLLVGCTRS